MKLLHLCHEELNLHCTSNSHSLLFLSDSVDAEFPDIEISQETEELKGRKAVMGKS